MTQQTVLTAAANSLPGDEPSTQERSTADVDVSDGQTWTAQDWNEIVRTHAHRVYRLTYRLCGNQHDAEDLTQEVFIRVFRSLSGYSRGTFQGWLHRITVNLFVDTVRRRSRIRFEYLADSAADRVQAVEPSPAQIHHDVQPEPDVQAALDALPTEFRTVIVLCDIEGLPYEEIAATLGVKIETIRSRIHRGRARLRIALAHRAGHGTDTTPPAGPPNPAPPYRWRLTEYR
ncbi:RNA polymerase sigma factor SigE [Streptomyces sp. NPDC006385]|uniref:RNA polymerase sigma factor SigE n=1 Tax=Streptomyces sp. NPDC006385 TaxID=3156761 RepID=UPI0033ADBE0D